MPVSLRARSVSVCASPSGYLLATCLPASQLRATMAANNNSLQFELELELNLNWAPLRRLRFGAGQDCRRLAAGLLAGLFLRTFPPSKWS